MAKIRFHKVAAVLVLAGFAAWIATGEFSEVGSAQQQETPDQPKPAPEEVKPVLRTVAVVTPPRIKHARAIHVAGQTAPNQRAVIATRVGGVIGELPVKQGDRVKAGDLILKLNAEEKVAAVDTAKALLAQRQGEWEAAERLAKSGNIPTLQVETAKAALAAAKSQLQAAESELERTEVLAPFGGWIDKVSVELGSSVMQGGQVATIINLDPILATGEVSERDLRYIKVDDAADIELVDGSEVKGRLRYVSRDATPATRTFRVEVAIDNPETKIPAGMTAEIVLRATPTDAVVLPRSVVTLSASGDLGIRAVDPANKVVFFPIDLVDDTPTGLVLAGIPADARIIVAGQDLVTEGDVVNPVMADEATIKKLIGEVTGTN